MQVTTLDPLTAKAESNPHKQSLTKDFDSFLTMLTTQLQNQDPLSPMDSTEFTNQLVQFSQLEQQISQSDKLDDLIATQKSAETSAALGYLGNEVEIISAVTMLDGGEARFAYKLPLESTSTTVTVFDEDGNIVRSFVGETGPGRHEATWDGTNDQGVLQADGAYSILVSAKDENNAPLTDITLYSKGVADEVISESGLTYLRIGDILVPLDRIVSVAADKTPKI